MGNRYIVAQLAVTPTAGNDVFSLISAANRRLRVLQVVAHGRGATSAAQGFTIGRAAAGTTPGGNITPGKADHTEEPNAVFTAPTTYAAQPTLDANQIPIGFNALGGPIVWNPPKGTLLEARNGEVISLRAASGITWQACSVAALVEED